MKEKVSKKTTKVNKKTTNSRVTSLLNPKKIQVARAKLGLTCSDVATKINVSRQFLSGVETGRVSTNKERADQIAKILKVKPLEIFKEDGSGHYFSK